MDGGMKSRSVYFFLGGAGGSGGGGGGIGTVRMGAGSWGNGAGTFLAMNLFIKVMRNEASANTMKSTASNWSASPTAFLTGEAPAISSSLSSSPKAISPRPINRLIHQGILLKATTGDVSRMTLLFIRSCADIITKNILRFGASYTPRFELL